MGNKDTRSIFALIFFGLVVPGIAGATLSDLVRDQPLAAAGVLLAYEALAVLLIPVGGVFGLWQQRAVTWVDARFQALLPNFRRQYRQYLQRRTERVDQNGLQIAVALAPRLDDVFVHVDLVDTSLQKAEESLLSGFDPSGKRTKLTDRLDSSQPVWLAVLGAPGSGKSTLLRHAVRTTLQRRKGQRTIPIWISLREHVVTITSAEATGLPDVVSASLDRSGLSDPPGWFERRLERGECVVLLDGLDEVTGFENRSKVANWITDQIAQYPDNHFVVSSRPYGYWETRIDSATVVQTLRLTSDQVHRFIHAWYLAIELDTMETASDAHAFARECADDLLSRLRLRPELLKLTGNPLLLTMIVNVHRESGQLPESRVELYRVVCTGVLGRMRRRPPQLRLGVEQRKLVLSEVAQTMMQKQSHDLERNAILGAIAPRLSKVSKHVTGEDFVTDTQVSGLMAEWDQTYSFAHQVFQEYLASVNLKERGLPDSVHLRGMVDDEWWRETLFLYACRSDATQVVQACLDAGTVHALALALDCADQARELEPDLRARLDRMLQAAFDDDTDPTRKLLARAWATRYLREKVELPHSGGRLCVQPVTVGLCRMFLAQRATATEHTPDTVPLSDDTPDSDVVHGTRSCDAKEIVAWINDILRGEDTFRLPTRTELSEYTTLHENPYQHSAFWMGSESGPDLWTSEEHLGRSVNDTTLTRQLKTDVRQLKPLVVRLLLIRSTRFLDALGCALSPDCELSAERVDFLFRALGRDASQRIGVDLARLLASGTARCLGLVRLLADKVDPVNAHIDVVDRAYQLSRQLDRIRAEHEHTSGSANHAYERAHQSSQELAAMNTDMAELDSSRVLDPSLTSQGPPFGRIMGRALSDALTTTLSAEGQWSDAGQFMDDLTQNLVTRVRIKSGRYHVTPEDLAKDVAEACRNLQRGLDERPPETEPDASAWARVAADRLQALAVPVFDRSEELTATAATAIRLLTLSLAVEADRDDGSDLGGDFRSIAAGVTLLHHRRTGEARATETIMLAVD